MFEELNAHRQAVRENIEKAFEIGFTENNDLEKAHKVGDIHPNGKWVWTQLPSGKFDWRVIKKKDGGSGKTTKTDTTDKPTESKQDSGKSDFEYSSEYKAMLESYSEIESKIREARRNKQMFLYKRLRDKAKSLEGKLQRLELKEKRKFYGVDKVVKELRKMGLSASNSIKTSIRGFSYSSNGYELPSYNSRSVEIHGGGKDNFDKIVSSLRKMGCEFDVKEYSSHSGGGTGIITNIDWRNNTK